MTPYEQERLNDFYCRLPTVLIPYIEKIPGFHRHMLLLVFNNTRNEWTTRGSGFVLKTGWYNYPIPLECIFIKEKEFKHIIFLTNDKHLSLMYMIISPIISIPYIYFTNYEQLKIHFPKRASELKNKL